MPDTALKEIARNKPLEGMHHVVQIGDDWHVLFEPKSLPRQYLSVARFQDFERADSYACVEQDMMLDCSELADYEDVRSIRDISGQQLKVIAANKAPQQIPDISRPLSEFEQEVVSDLPALMKEYPYGASVDDLIEFYGLSEEKHRARQAVKTLSARGLAQFVKWPDDALKRLIPLGDFQRPPMRLTEAEEAIMRALPTILDADGICRASPRAIGIQAGLPTGVVLNTMWRLHHKDKIKMHDPTGSAATCEIAGEPSSLSGDERNG